MSVIDQSFLAWLLPIAIPLLSIGSLYAMVRWINSDFLGRDWWRRPFRW